MQSVHNEIPTEKLMPSVWNNMSLLCTIPENPKAPLQKIDFLSQYKEYNRLPCVSHLDDGKWRKKSCFLAAFVMIYLTQIKSAPTSRSVKPKV